MFWGGKKKEDDKERQLKQFKYAFPSLRRPNNDDTLFEIRFMVENIHNALRIAIPNDFPTTKPVLDVVGNVSHPWLDPYKRVVGSPKLNAWTKHSVLTEVIEETLAALSMATAIQPTSAIPHSSSSSGQPTGYGNPISTFPTSLPPTQQYPGPTAAPIRQSLSNPNLSQNQSQLYGAGPTPSTGNQQNYSVAGYTINQTASPSNNNNPASKIPSPIIQKPTANPKDDFDFEGEKSPIPLPEIPQSFPELEKLTDVQLERLLTDEVALEKLVDAQKSIEEMTILRDDMRQTNSEKASKNVVVGEELNNLQKQAEQLQIQLKDSTSQYLKDYNEKRKKHVLHVEDIFKELNVKNEQIDQESEKTAESFLNGEMDISAFQQLYLEQRIRYHTLNAKMLLAKQQL